MNSSIVMTIIGITVLTTATIGFGATLSTPLEFNLIGASDNTSIGSARANVTSIDFIQEVGSNGVIQINGTTFSVGNEDTVNVHVFQVCLAMEGPIGVFTPAAGQSPACTSTLSIAANAIHTDHTINFLTTMNVTSLQNISVSVEELS
ncbi:MAG: hypothetical protein COA77_09850 [Thaumarchaeota archaeon]|nr:MAG: hypothetical protein COA77_09850 [Nitrososphaerota archaeon]